MLPTNFYLRLHNLMPVKQPHPKLPRRAWNRSLR